MVKKITIIGLTFLALVIGLVSCATTTKNFTQKKPYPKFTRADSLHGFLNEFRSCFDVRHYTIEVKINPTEKYIQGRSTMKFNVVAEQPIMQIDLSSVLQIDSIVIDNIKCTKYKREYDAVFVTLPQSLTVASQHYLTCYYRGNPQEAKRPPWEGGMVWSTSKSGKPWFGVTCETLGASCWVPCKDHLSDEPEEGMYLSVVLPSSLGIEVVSNGVCTLKGCVDDWCKWEWETKYPINTYNMTFYGGDFVKYSEEYQGIAETFPLDFYVLSEDVEKSKESFAQAKKVIAAYEDLYGPYPWGKENYKLVESPYEGMEHQTAIAYGSGFKDMFGMDYIIVHESAHEWWGNAVSVDDYAEIFIHEGIAMYSEFLYQERMAGKEKSEVYANMWKRGMKNIRPVVGPRDVNFWDYRDTDPYVKGAWTLHGLRYVMDNDSLFFDILKTYNMSRRYEIVTVKDFTDYVNEKTGTDYSWYFNQYLYSAKVPTLEWRWIPIKELEKYREKVDYVLDLTDSAEELARVSYLQVRWTNVDTSFKLPLSFIIKDSTGRDIQPNIYVGNGLREQKIDRVSVTTDGVIIKRYGNGSEPLYFNTSKAYFETQNVKK